MKYKVLRSFVSSQGAFSIGQEVSINNAEDFVKAGFVKPLENVSKKETQIEKEEEVKKSKKSK